MKNLFIASAILGASILTMSCTSTSTTIEQQPVSASTESTNTSPTDTTKADANANTIKEIIVDVRTQGEWDNDGHAPCSKLIPLDQLEQRVEELRGYSKITVVCRSGGRAGRAAQFLKSAGFNDVTNAGPWQNANCN